MRKIEPSEHKIQCAIIEWAQTQSIEFLEMRANSEGKNEKLSIGDFFRYTKWWK